MKRSLLHLLLVLCCGTCVRLLHGVRRLPPFIRRAAGFSAETGETRLRVHLGANPPSALFRADTGKAALFCDLGDTTIFGRLYAGPEYFDEQNVDYFETRYAQQAEILSGRCLLPVKLYFDSGT